MDTEKSSAPARSTDHPEVLAGDPFAHAGAHKRRERLQETDLLTALRIKVRVTPVPRQGAFDTK